MNISPEEITGIFFLTPMNQRDALYALLLKQSETADMDPDMDPNEKILLRSKLSRSLTICYEMMISSSSSGSIVKEQQEDFYSILLKQIETPNISSKLEGKSFDLKLMAIHWLVVNGNDNKLSNTIVSKMTPSAIRIAAIFYLLYAEDEINLAKTEIRLAEVEIQDADEKTRSEIRIADIKAESEIRVARIKAETEIRVAHIKADADINTWTTGHKIDAESTFHKMESKILQEVITDLITFLEIPSFVALKDAQDHVLQKLKTRPCAWNGLTYLEINEQNTSVLQVMYANPATREYARDIMRLILHYIHETCPDFTYRYVYYINMDTVVMPALIRQLYQSINVIGEKSLLATAIELNDRDDIAMILRCQGVNVSL